MKVLKGLASSPVIAALLFLIGCVVLAQGPSLAQIYLWSQTPGTNATVDPSINWATGMAPSSVSPSARTMMAKTAQARDDWSGANVTGGTSTAYTLTSNQVFDTLAHLNNQQVCFTPNATNGVNPTLAVDGLAALPIDSSPSVPIGAGVLILGTPYCVVYNNSNQQFYLRSFYGNQFSVPLGTVLDYTGTSAPNSNFALAYGQAISRTTYATYFSLVSTTFGSGDGVTTFNIPDLRGRVIAGLDNMGGTSASRLSGCTNNTTLGGGCGAQNQTVAQANLPNVNFNVTVTDPGHSHSMAQATTNTGTTSPAFVYATGGGTGSGFTATATTGISVAVNSGGSGTALPTVQPTLMISKIVRIF